jgi:hypothetical protein
VRRVFADTLYWLAIFLPGDAWATAARSADVSEALLITTEEVLTEFLTAVSAHGDYTRRLACRLVREILSDPVALLQLRYSLRIGVGSLLFLSEFDEGFARGSRDK